jgi:protein-tyrosine-phosphatase
MSSTILFLCPHGAAKSVLAAAYFNRLAQQSSLPLTADSAGTEPDEAVSPVVVKMLRIEGIDVSQHLPRRVTRDDLEQAQRIVSLGCALEDLEIAPERVEQWLDVPLMSQDPDGSRDAIRSHVEALVAQLRARAG